MPVLPRFGSQMKSVWSSTRSKLLGSHFKSDESGGLSEDVKAWNDTNDFRDQYKVGAIQLEDQRFDSLDRLDEAHRAAA